MMIDCPCRGFQRLQDEDIQDVMHYLKLANYAECNHNIVTLIMWRFYYPVWIWKQENYICLIGRYSEQWFMYMPLCEQTYFLEAVSCVWDCFREAQIPFHMSCFTEKQMKMVKEAFSDLCVIEDRNGFDYVYLTTSLKTFAGKKLQKKRNHLQAFYKMYSFVYESITDENMQECIDFLNLWNQEETDLMLEEERKGILEVFRLWHQLPCMGGLIRIEGKVQAFIISSPLTKDMVQINVEKADKSIRGLYQAILREHIAHELEGYTYINREDDMGLENLRQAKMAYHPCELVKKYRLWEV